MAQLRSFLFSCADFLFSCADFASTSQTMSHGKSSSDDDVLAKALAQVHLECEESMEEDSDNA